MDSFSSMTAPPDTPPPTAQGTLAKTPFPHLLIYLLERQLTGSIELTAPDGKRATVLIIEGFPAKARTSEAGSHLGQVMRDDVLITDAQLSAPMEHFRP